jgi:hypothetical protein
MINKTFIYLALIIFSSIGLFFVTVTFGHSIYYFIERLVGLFFLV